MCIRDSPYAFVVLVENAGGGLTNAGAVANTVLQAAVNKMCIRDRAYAALVLTQWFCYVLMRTMDRSGFEVEMIAFFLCTLGLEICATSTPDDLTKEIILITGLRPVHHRHQIGRAHV